MSWRVEKDTGDIVIEGFENGIASSPHKGIGNMQNVNITTETGEVMVSYGRAQQSMANTTDTGTITAQDASHIQVSITAGGTTTTMYAGTWITVSASTITGLSNGNYYVTQVSGGFIAQLSTTYRGSVVAGMGSTGTATFTMIRNMTRPIAKATEPYNTASAQQYRYYVLDSQGLIWVYDTALADSSLGLAWLLPEIAINYFGSETAPSGMAVLNGFLHVFSGSTIWVKPTVNLADSFSAFASGVMTCVPTTLNPHFAFVGHQGKLYYTDGNLIGSIFPNTSLITGGANIQSYASYTAVTTTGTISALIGGTLPTFNDGSSTRIPAVFFPATGGTKPTALTVGTIYYIQYSLGLGTFGVYAAATGGAALDIATGAVGTQYFNTYWGISAGGTATITFSPERLNLPFFEIAQAIAELGSNVLIGCRGNTMYPWNQVDALPGDLIALPESNVAYLLTVNNMVYIFAGRKGNIYITSGSSAAAALTVPDYTSGLIEPYFTWGGAMYLRGRVYFSILDQTASHTGQCGGVWSFIPTQNFYLGQDQGTALRLENQNSYGTYNGYATVLIANEDQGANGPQYWSGWQSTLSSPKYGIDNSSTTPVASAVIDMDLIPTGTAINKTTFSQIEYKLAVPLIAGESVSMKYRLNLSDAFATCGTVKRDSTTALSGYFNINFQKTQWVQLQATLTAANSSNTSFVRLAQVRLR